MDTLNRLVSIGVARDRIGLKYFGVERQEWIDRQDRDEISILYVGRLVDFKGPDLLLQAFLSACECGLQGILIIAGDGPLMEACKAQKEGSKYKHRVKLLGSVTSETADQLYTNADIFSCHHCKGSRSNRVEAFGVTIIEAMSYGLPVVTGASGGVTETVIDGETGYLFTPGDIEAHKDCLMRLARNNSLRRKLGREGWIRVNNYFTTEAEEKRLVEILS